MGFSQVKKRTVQWLIGGLVLSLVLGLGFALGRISLSDKGDTHAETQMDKKILFWTCAMHPEVNRSKPGICPKCPMKLIAVYQETDDLGPTELRLSERARKLAEVETAVVERRFVTAQIRMVGKVAFDETRLSDITAWVPGRLDRMFVNYTGVPVKKGDHLFELYSPQLLTTQQELIQALKTVAQTKESAVSGIRETAELTVKAVRERLRLWGLTPEQIANIEKSGKPTDHITIYAKTGGIVIHKHQREGAEVPRGARIYTIADLSSVWVMLDAYESDLAWLKYGQKIEFETEAYPGQKFKGTIAFIDPFLNPRTRTAKIRVNVDNSDGKLLPDMFVRAVVFARMTQTGEVLDVNLAGKWISPMHPEIIKDAPGLCDICQMKLVPAEELGYVTHVADPNAAPLVIPASAPLITGKRAVVYVAIPGQKGRYEGREVVLGSRAGDYYVVRSGLDEGERVVTRGAFKIDSALQIMAKPSMMNPQGGPKAESGHQHHH